MSQLEELKTKIQKIDAQSDKMDQANDVLRDLENAILDLHRKVNLGIDWYIDPKGEHKVSMEYRRGDVQGMKGVWGLFLRELIHDNCSDCSEETTWHWANAPGVLRIKAASNSERFTAECTKIADSLIAELPTQGTL